MAERPQAAWFSQEIPQQSYTLINSLGPLKELALYQLTPEINVCFWVLYLN